MNRRGYEEKETKITRLDDIKVDDPFSEFTNCFEKSGNRINSNAFNDFGDFNMNFAKEEIKQ